MGLLGAEFKACSIRWVCSEVSDSIVRQHSHALIPSHDMITSEPKSADAPVGCSGALPVNGCVLLPTVTNDPTESCIRSSRSVDKGFWREQASTLLSIVVGLYDLALALSPLVGLKFKDLARNQPNYLDANIVASMRLGAKSVRLL